MNVKRRILVLPTLGHVSPLVQLAGLLIYGWFEGQLRLMTWIVLVCCFFERNFSAYSFRQAMKDGSGAVSAGVKKRLRSIFKTYYGTSMIATVAAGVVIVFRRTMGELTLVLLIVATAMWVLAAYLAVISAARLHRLLREVAQSEPDLESQAGIRSQPERRRR